MNKSQFAEALSKQTSLTLSQSIAAVDGMVEIMREAFIANEPISFHGFGRFDSRVQAERVGRNMQTNQQITIPAQTVVKFHPFKETKQSFIK
jgi:nucleoid DNA-binding protein